MVNSRSIGSRLGFADLKTPATETLCDGESERDGRGMGPMVSDKAFRGATLIRGGWVANPLFECLHPLSGGIRTDLGVGTLPRRVLPGAVVLIPDCGAQSLCPFAFRAARGDLGRPLYRPWGAVNGVRALAPSPAWFPGRRGTRPGRGAHHSFSPNNCTTTPRKAQK
jgi:hypothetical protein